MSTPSTMKWFGESWNAAILDHLEHVITPTGDPCGWCTEPIEEGHRGYVIPHLSAGRPPVLQPWHLECFLRSTFGSIAHQIKECGCYQGNDRGEREEGMTLRQAALVTYDWMLLCRAEAKGLVE